MTEHTLNLPLVRYHDDTQPALGDQNPNGKRHLLILYGPDDGEANIEHIRRVINTHAELLALLEDARRIIGSLEFYKFRQHEVDRIVAWCARDDAFTGVPRAMVKPGDPSAKGYAP